MKRGKFIVIDGSDGSGKKTQTVLLIKKLKKLGLKTSYFDFPQYEKSFFGKMVGKYLNGDFGMADDVNPYLSSILYAGDRFEAKDKIYREIKLGKIVVSNRYIQSNMAFQGAKIKNLKQKREFIKWLEEMEYKVFEIPRADLVFYLYMPHRFSQKLVDKKGRRQYTKLKRDIHEADTDFLSRAEREYLRLSKICPEWRIINCFNRGDIETPEIISEKIIEVVRKEILRFKQKMIIN